MNQEEQASRNFHSPQPASSSSSSSSPSSSSSSSCLLSTPATSSSSSSFSKPPSNAFARMNNLQSLYVPIQQLKQQKRIKAKVLQFYDKQNEQLDELQTVHTFHQMEESSVAEEEADRDASVARAIRYSFYCTLVLILMKSFTAFWSSSIAVVSTAVDSGLDLLSQGTLLLASRAMQKHDPHNFPFGKARMEPLGLVIFACIMGMAAVILLSEAIRTLVEGLDSHPQVRIDVIVLAIIGCVILLQLCFYFYCKRVSVACQNNASAKALADDHLNDVCINLIGGIPAIVSGFVTSLWWLDSAGAMGLSVYIAVRWCRTCYEQIDSLIGRSAPSNLISQVVYLASNHCPLVKKVDTVLAYSVGYRYQVECHIVLPEDLPLRESHDIGEALERKIELLDWVEMAFVHADYEWRHKPEHKYRSVMRSQLLGMGSERKNKNNNNTNNNTNNNKANTNNSDVNECAEAVPLKEVVTATSGSNSSSSRAFEAELAVLHKTLPSSS